MSILELEKQVKDLVEGNQGVVYAGNFRMVDGQLYIEKGSDCPSERSNPAQIAVGLIEGRLLVKFKEDTPVRVAGECGGLVKITSCGPGKAIPYDLREDKRRLDEIRSGLGSGDWKKGEKNGGKQ